MPPARVWPEGQGWNYAERFGQKEPDLIIRDQPWTQKAGQGNAWFKRMVETGVTEPRWVRAIEVRPGSVKGRKITHHANVEIDQVEPDGTVTVGRFMEWAVGKEGELMRPNTGKLMLPGSRIAWDVHYASTDEDVTDAVEMGVYFYPKGQEPKYRQTLLSIGSSGEALDIPPNSVVAHEGYFVLPKAARIESFQPHMHLRGKAQSLEAILPTGQKVMLSQSPTSPSTGTTPTSTPTMRRRCCRRARCSKRPRGTTTPRRTSRIRIRTSGSATATARSTR